MIDHKLRARALRLLGVLVLCVASLAARPVPAPAESVSDLTFRMLHEVRRLRGLEPKTSVGIGQKSEGALQSLLQQRIDEEYTSDQLAALQKLLALTGLIPADYDLIKRYVELLASQALGFYDFRTETFYLSTSADAGLNAAVVLHELTHALQDQHFGIYKRLKAMRDDEDARTALQTLVEGEATALMIELTLEQAGRRFYTMPHDELRSLVGEQKDIFKDDPPVMRDFLYFPYEAGLPFMRAVRRRMPWSGVNELYASPPASTEQVLHPERLLTRPDPPRAVRWPDVTRALGGRWRPLDENNLGEMGAYLLVKPASGDDLQAREAAAGWGGDRYLVLEEAGSGRAAALLAFAWDTERDAEEFAEAYRRAVELRAGGASLQAGPEGEGWVAQLPQGLTFVGRRAERVLVLEGVPDGALSLFRRLGWSAEAAPPSASPPPTEGLARREHLRRQAESLLKAGDPKGAAAAARQAVEISSDDAEALYLLGTALASEEATRAEGLDALTHAVNREPSLGPALLALGQALRGLGLEEEARGHLERAQAIMPDHPEAARAYAELLLEEGRAEEAWKALGPLLAGPRREAALMTLLGRAALARGRPKEARSHLAASLGVEPSAEAHLALGALERKEGDLQAAEEHLRAASDLDKKGTSALAALGELYRGQKLWGQARSAYEAAFGRDPGDPAPPTALGEIALAAGDRAGAEIWFTYALAADPRWRPALGGLKSILEAEGRPTGRVEALLGRPPALDASARRAVRAGRRCLERGLLKRARQQFEAAVHIDREHPGAWDGLGQVHEREDRLELAKVAYLKALDAPDPLAAEVEDRLFRWVAERRIAEAADPVLRRFLNARDDGGRQRAALALGALGDRRLAPLLVDHLGRHSPPVQAALAETIGRLGDPAAVGPLERLAASSRDPEVLSAVERALARLEGPTGSARRGEN